MNEGRRGNVEAVDLFHFIAFLTFQFLHSHFIKVLNLFGVLWVIPNSILQLLYCWKTQGREHSNETIWREKNQHLFKDGESDVLCLKFSLKSLLDWTITYVPNCSLNLENLINFLNFRHRTLRVIDSLIYFLCTMLSFW